MKLKLFYNPKTGKEGLVMWIPDVTTDEGADEVVDFLSYLKERNGDEQVLEVYNQILKVIKEYKKPN